MLDEHFVIIFSTDVNGKNIKKPTRVRKWKKLHLLHKILKINFTIMQICTILFLE